MGTVAGQCYKGPAIAKRRKVVALSGGSCLGRKPAATDCASNVSLEEHRVTHHA